MENLFKLIEYELVDIVEKQKKKKKIILHYETSSKFKII